MLDNSHNYSACFPREMYYFMPSKKIAPVDLLRFENKLLVEVNKWKEFKNITHNGWL